MPGRRLTSTTELLKQCNYLSVQQMVHYHSVALVHKVLVHQAPVHLYHIVSRALASGVRHLYDTRAACRRDVAPVRLAAANTSWRWRPTALRKEESLQDWQDCGSTPWNTWPSSHLPLAAKQNIFDSFQWSVPYFTETHISRIFKASSGFMMAHFEAYFHVMTVGTSNKCAVNMKIMTRTLQTEANVKFGKVKVKKTAFFWIKHFF